MHRNINIRKKEISECAKELLTVDKPLAKLWVFAENWEDSKSSGPSSVSSKEF
jgi:hypothetical protein